MPFWSVVRSLPKREVFAAEQLGLRGYETFLPLVPTKRASAPLFAGYFFIRIIEQWRVVNRTLGVLCLVRVGDCPARCPDNEIERLKAMIDGHGFVRLPDRPRSPPPRFKIAMQGENYLPGLSQGVAALHAGLSAAEKEILLIGMLGATPGCVPAHLVVPQ